MVEPRLHVEVSVLTCKFETTKLSESHFLCSPQLFASGKSRLYTFSYKCVGVFDGGWNTCWVRSANLKMNLTMRSSTSNMKVNEELKPGVMFVISDAATVFVI